MINIQQHVSLAAYTTLQIGGCADWFSIPTSSDELIAAVEWAASKKIPYFILGGGANILVSDQGFRGLVICTRELNNCSVVEHNNSHTLVDIDAGADVTQACEWCCRQELGGLDFLHSMPGTLGGAVWMNARCYGSEIADILHSVVYYTPGFGLERYTFAAGDWAYKKSPFQDSDRIILTVRLQLQHETADVIQKRMNTYSQDRIQKGHFRFPSAGSTFKNNYDYGQPTGKIIDELNLRGTAQGDAQIAPYHGNIFINTGNATAADMYSLITHVQQTVLERRGVELEPEIRFIGDWQRD